MHYPDAGREYEEALQALGRAIKTARAGDYRTGYLSILLEGLNMVKAASHKVGRYGRDGQMLDTLIAECHEALSAREQEAGPSPLADLFHEHQHHPEHQPGAGQYDAESAENPGPLHGRRMMGR